jgi:queuine tRNA-ribosyltransferase
MSTLRFDLIRQDPRSHARSGTIRTHRGDIETPVFMPVGTQATVKAQTQEMLEQLGASIILANTYHLYLRPGHELIRELGGLHRFMAWSRPLLTDSGGFQVYSLSSLRKLSAEGIEFTSHLDGSRHFLTPERSIGIQLALGSDIIMALDECKRNPTSWEEAEAAVTLTTQWARRCNEYYQNAKPEEERGSCLFGIVQGSTFHDLRHQSLSSLQEIGFDGYAIGGLSVGEGKQEMYDTVEATAPSLPEDQPRYLMGVGTPLDLVECVARGVDMFDCVMPTRNARNGQVFTWAGPLNIKSAVHSREPGPIDSDCGCAVCRRYSRAYLRHLYASNEILSAILCTHHNLFFYLDMTKKMRQAIALGNFAEFRAAFTSKYQSGSES